MKPISVAFAAFGSYPGSVTVDFASLAARGLFVVTGDTGTGKSTIFDAMSFALFGKMPSKDGGDIRSHHATSSIDTFARFTFEVDGVEYTAERSPSYLRPKKTGHGATPQAASQLLTRRENDGSTTTLATKVREFDAHIGEIIGLDAEQFRRVMLLPQGEVARFLLDDSKQREELLSQLFGGAVYERVVKELKSTSDELAQQVGNVDEQLRHQLANARDHLNELYTQLGVEPPDLAEHPRNGLEDILAGIEHERTQLDTDATRAHDDASAAQRNSDDAIAAAQRFDDAARHRSTLARLEADEPEVVAAASAATTSRSARPVVAAQARLDEAIAGERSAQSDLNTRTAQIVETGTSAGIEIGDLSAIGLSRQHADLRSQLDKDRAALAAAEGAATEATLAAQALADNERAQRETSERIASISSEIEAHEQQQAQFADHALDTSAIDTEHERLTTARTTIIDRDAAVSHRTVALDAATRADAAFDAILERYVATESPRLAERLTPGEPCMVCGSLEHPAPATADGGTVVSIDEVNSARERREAARLEADEAERHLAALTTSLGDLAETTVSELDSLIAENRSAHAATIAAIAERRQLAVRLEQLNSDLVAATTTSHQAAGAEPGLIVTRDRTAAASAAARVVADAIDVDVLNVISRSCDELEQLIAGLEELYTTLTSARSRRESAEGVLHDALTTSPFESVDDATTALIDERAEQTALDRLDALKQERLFAQSALDTLTTSGIPDERPDVSTLLERAKVAHEHARSLSQQRTIVERAHAAVISALAEHDRIGESSSELRGRADAARRAHGVCSGAIGNKISLRRWVLGRELERVAQVASVHLASMTGSRYTIQRSSTSGDGRTTQGLDLEILDAHTGRPRRPNSLSGGEQFQASLALALGLADVVSHGGAGSGRRIEALFIDEGFGSLDPRALDDAIETLHQLRASGRMVGAITHVEAMKERLHPGIVVSRRPDGKGSTLVVNP